MKDLLLKIGLLYQHLTKREEKYKRDEIRPTQDWSTILVISFVIFCVFMMLSFYFYLQIKNDKLFKTTKTSALNEKKINIDLLRKTVEDINNREKLINDIKNNGAKPRDPSL